MTLNKNTRKKIMKKQRTRKGGVWNMVKTADEFVQQASRYNGPYNDEDLGNFIENYQQENIRPQLQGRKNALKLSAVSRVAQNFIENPTIDTGSMPYAQTKQEFTKNVPQPYVAPEHEDATEMQQMQPQPTLVSHHPILIMNGIAYYLIILTQPVETPQYAVFNINGLDYYLVPMSLPIQQNVQPTQDDEIYASGTAEDVAPPVPNTPAPDLQQARLKYVLEQARHKQTN